MLRSYTFHKNGNDLFACEDESIERAEERCRAIGLDPDGLCIRIQHLGDRSRDAGGNPK